MEWKTIATIIKEKKPRKIKYIINKIVYSNSFNFCKSSQLHPITMTIPNSNNIKSQEKEKNQTWLKLKYNFLFWLFLWNEFDWIESNWGSRMRERDREEVSALSAINQAITQQQINYFIFISHFSVSPFNLFPLWTLQVFLFYFIHFALAASFQYSFP